MKCDRFTNSYLVCKVRKSLMQNVFVILLIFFLSLSCNSVFALYPNQKKGDIGLVHLAYVQSDGGDKWGFMNEFWINYGLTDRFELQLVTSLVATYRAFGLGYEQIKTKYQLYKNSSNTFFVAGAFSIKSPQWLSDTQKLAHLASGKRWKPAMHLIIDWIPNKTFSIMSQIYYTDARDYSSITLELSPIVAFTPKFDIRFFYKGVYNLQHFKSGSISLYDIYATYQVTKKLRLGAGMFYWHLMSDERFDKRRLSALMYLYYNFHVGSPF